MKRNSILSAIMLLSIILVDANADERSIVVSFRPNQISMPENRAESSMDSVNFSSQDLKDFFRRKGAYRIARGISGYDTIDTTFRLANGRFFRKLDFSRIYVINLQGEGEVQSIVDSLATYHGTVLNFAELNEGPRPEGRLIPKDSLFTKQWGFDCYPPFLCNNKDIDAPEGWDIYTGSSSIKIGVIDGGVQLNNPDSAVNGVV